MTRRNMDRFQRYRMPRSRGGPAILAGAALAAAAAVMAALLLCAAPAGASAVYSLENDDASIHLVVQRDSSYPGYPALVSVNVTNSMTAPLSVSFEASTDENYTAPPAVTGSVPAGANATFELYLEHVKGMVNDRIDFTISVLVANGTDTIFQFDMPLTVMFGSGDFDRDGVPDEYDPDDDNDGYPDSVEVEYGANPLDNRSAPPDMDGDLSADADDSFPMDPTQWDDSDADGYGDNMTGGRPDHFPLDPTQWDDSDSDYFGDNATGVNPDRFPYDPAASMDNDSDGHPDRWNTGMSQANSTSIPPLEPDAFVNDSAAAVDRDGDGHPDAWNAGMSQEDSTTGLFLDRFPSDGGEWNDSDGDGMGDNGDLDDDNDGWTDRDEELSFSDPLDEKSVPLDTDGDLMPDARDKDDDNDGIKDSLDKFPLDPSESSDNDADGIGDNADLDDDNDGIPDLEDPYPLDAKRNAVLWESLSLTFYQKMAMTVFMVVVIVMIHALYIRLRSRRIAPAGRPATEKPRATAPPKGTAPRGGGRAR